MNNEFESNYVVEDDLDFDATYEEHEEEQIENLTLKDKALYYKDKCKEYLVNNKKTVYIVIGILAFLFLINRFSTVMSYINDSTNYKNNTSNNTSNNYNPVGDNKSIEVVFSDKTIYVNRNSSIKVFVSVLGLNNYNINYSLKDDIATISDNYIYGKKLGKTILTASIDYNGKTYSDECEVLVIDGKFDVELKDIIIDSNISLYTGDVRMFNVSYNPVDARIESYDVSINNDVVSFDNNTIKANKPGNSIITIKVNDLIKYVYVTVCDRYVENNINNNTNNSNNSYYNDNSSNNSYYNDNNNSNNSNSNNTSISTNFVSYFEKNNYLKSSYNDSSKNQSNSYVTITISNKVDKLYYCIYKYGEKECNPYLVKYKGDKISIVKSGVNVIKFYGLKNNTKSDIYKMYINVK